MPGIQGSTISIAFPCLLRVPDPSLPLRRPGYHPCLQLTLKSSTISCRPILPFLGSTPTQPLTLMATLPKRPDLAVIHANLQSDNQLPAPLHYLRQRLPFPNRPPNLVRRRGLLGPCFSGQALPRRRFPLPMIKPYPTHRPPVSVARSRHHYGFSKRLTSTLTNPSPVTYRRSLIRVNEEQVHHPSQTMCPKQSLSLSSVLNGRIARRLLSGAREAPQRCRG